MVNCSMICAVLAGVVEVWFVLGWEAKMDGVLKVYDILNLVFR